MVRPFRNDSNGSSSDGNSSGAISPRPRPEQTGSQETARQPVSLDPNQMFILSGPFPSPEHKSGVMIARPIPPGVTVIAKPCPGYPAIPLPPQQTLVTPASTTTSSSNNVKFNPDAKPFIPAANCVQTPETPPGSTQSQPANKSKNKPMVMVWNATCPEGRLVPVRQPAPPVYFH